MFRLVAVRGNHDLGIIDMPQARRMSADAGRSRRFFIRGRHVLIASLLGAFVWEVVPRLSAAWALQTAATALADYALCMVGPTGPAALRDGSDQYRLLLRRRLNATAADAAPFADCAVLAERLSGAKPEQAVQLAWAGAFVEYALDDALREGMGAPGAPLVSLESLLLSTRSIADLAERAWPFVRGGYSKRIKPSSHAREAPHPLAAPRPLRGRGLPDWSAWYRSVREDANGAWLAYGGGANLAVLRSTDGGLSWNVQPSGSRVVAKIKERCVVNDALDSFRFSSDADGTTTTVRSVSHEDEIASEQPLFSAEHELRGVGCGGGALVALVKERVGLQKGYLVSCAYGGECKSMPLPSMGQERRLEPAISDVARIGRTTIVSTVSDGVVRVASSRDEGQSWTPFSVAYDSAESQSNGRAGPPPARLLAIGRRLLLVGGPAERDGSYSVLISDDAGASWRGES